jgi:hypothetical protein
MSRKGIIFFLFLWGLLATTTPHCEFCAFGCCFCLDFGPFFLSTLVFLRVLFSYLFECMGVLFLSYFRIPYAFGPNESLCDSQ